MSTSPFALTPCDAFDDARDILGNGDRREVVRVKEITKRVRRIDLAQSLPLLIIPTAGAAAAVQFGK
jgi:hypothetical protein